MIFGLLPLPWWGYIVVTLVLTHITIVAVTVYLHRYQAHRAMEMHPILSHFFRAWLWLTTGMVTKEWVAIHRRHHAEVETEGDPHSPQVLGLRKVLWEGAELYRAARKKRESIQQYGVGTPDDWMEWNVYEPGKGQGIVLMLILDMLLFGIPGISIWAVQMVWIPFFAAGIINGVGHYWGYRNFESNDASTNISPIGIIIGGEEFHNNHHAYPTSAKLSIKWWEFDIGWMYIKIFEYLGLAKVKQLPPKLSHNPDKTGIDGETVKVIVGSRLEVLNMYYARVILPVLHEERDKVQSGGNAFFHKAKQMLRRDRSLIDDAGRECLSTLFDRCEKVKEVYHFKIKLQSIWERRVSNPSEILEALHEWCRQAEASGLDVLRDFIQRLQGYRLRQALV